MCADGNPCPAWESPQAMLQRKQQVLTPLQILAHADARSAAEGQAVANVLFAQIITAEYG